jgi:hypothetical protein
MLLCLHWFTFSLLKITHQIDGIATGMVAGIERFVVAVPACLNTLVKSFSWGIEIDTQYQNYHMHCRRETYTVRLSARGNQKLVFNAPANHTEASINSTSSNQDSIYDHYCIRPALPFLFFALLTRILWLPSAPPPSGSIDTAVKRGTTAVGHPSIQTTSALAHPHYDYRERDQLAENRHQDEGLFICAAGPAANGRLVLDVGRCGPLL